MFSEVEFNFNNLTTKEKTQARVLVGYTGNGMDLDELIKLLAQAKVLPSKLCQLCGQTRNTVKLWTLWAIDEGLV